MVPVTARKLCPACREAYARQCCERRHQFLADVVYLLTWTVLIVTAPCNPRAWKRYR